MVTRVAPVAALGSAGLRSQARFHCPVKSVPSCIVHWPGRNPFSSSTSWRGSTAISVSTMGVVVAGSRARRLVSTGAQAAASSVAAATAISNGRMGPPGVQGMRWPSPTVSRAHRAVHHVRADSSPALSPGSRATDVNPPAWWAFAFMAGPRGSLLQ